MLGITVVELCVAQLLELGRRILVHCYLSTELVKALRLYPCEGIDMVLSEVPVEVQYVRGRLDHELIAETLTYAILSSTIAGERADILEALEEGILDRIGGLEGEVVREADLCTSIPRSVPTSVR